MHEHAKETSVDVLCKHCGQTFSAFLQEMAEKNSKVMCPCCGEHSEYGPPETATPPAAKN